MPNRTMESCQARFGTLERDDEVEQIVHQCRDRHDKRELRGGQRLNGLVLAEGVAGEKPCECLCEGRESEHAVVPGKHIHHQSEHEPGR